MRLPIEQHRKRHPGDVRAATVIAFVVSRGKIVADGYNRRMDVPVDGKFSYHAEEVALKKAGRRASGATLYVVRVKKDNSRGLAKPCVRCMEAINRTGIVRVYFTLDASNAWGKLIWKGSQWLLVA